MDPKKSWSPRNPWIFTKKTPFMQRLADRVRTGSTLYIHGQTSIKGVPGLCQKLASRYPLNLTPMQAARRRKAGHGTYHWMGYYSADTGQVWWFLLLDPGNQIDRTDNWLGVHSERPKLGGYELVRHTRPGASSPAYSWRYTRTRVEEIRHALVTAVRRRSTVELQQLVHVLWRSPGFALVRDQVQTFRKLIVAEWKRAGLDPRQMVQIPRAIGYVRRLQDRGEVWSILMAERHRAGVLDDTPVKAVYSVSTV